MLALAVSGRAAAEAAVEIGLSRGHAAIAAHNARDQWVVSGDWPALRAIANGAAAAPLAVQGAWHSRAMAGAVEEFRTALRSAVSAPPRVPIVCNRAGRAISGTADMVDAIAEQLIRPVEWTATLQTVAAMHVRAVVVIGPAKALRRMVRATCGDSMEVQSVETPDDLPEPGRTLA
jgi:[acyl-carrier-protein] S-malonyltransferase